MRLKSLLLAAALLLPLHAAAEKVFRYAFEIAETGFDPAELSDLYSSTVIANIFDTPLTYDYLARPIRLIPNTLAAMPEVTEQGTLYTALAGMLNLLAMIDVLYCDAAARRRQNAATPVRPGNIAGVQV